MTQEEKIAMANIVRNRDRFGPVSAEELAALPGKETEIFITTRSDMKVHVFEEKPKTNFDAMIINFHGGGFIKGRTDRDHRYASTIMAELSALVWDIDYSLAPENPFPYAADEAYEISLYAFEHAKELGVSEDKIVLVGHSAGGNLVASALIKNSYTHELHPCCALMEYLPTDNSVNPIERLSDELKKDPFWVKRAETEKLYTDFYVGESDPKNSRLSPKFASDEELKAFPDSLVISADKDSLRDDTESFAFNLAKSGVCTTIKRIENAVHGFTVNRTDGWEEGLSLHCKFIKQHIN